MGWIFCRFRGQLMIKHRYNILTSLALVITAFVIFSCTTSIDSLKNSYDIGTNIDDVMIKQKDNGSFFAYEKYCFWNENEYSVSVHYNDESREIDSNSFSNECVGNNEKLTNINHGDDIFRVVSFLGVPISCGTSGVQSLIFDMQDADGCRVYFYNENSFLKVSHLEILSKS